MSNVESNCTNSAAIPTIETADYFTACRGRGANAVRKQFLTLDAAETYADSFGDSRTMIYAVSNFGRFNHVKNR